MADGAPQTVTMSKLSVSNVEYTIYKSFRRGNLTPQSDLGDSTFAIFISRIMGLRGKGAIHLESQEDENGRCVVTVTPIWESFREIFLRALARERLFEFDIKRGASYKLAEKTITLLLETDSQTPERSAYKYAYVIHQICSHKPR